MNDTALLGLWVRRFLLEHLIVERNLSHQTQLSYRNTLRLLLPFVAGQCHQSLDRLTVEQVSAERLLFLYNSGARASEAAGLKIADLDLPQLAVRLLGKGNKIRYCPLWPTTVQTLAPLVADRAPTDPVFLNRCGQPITRFGIHTLVERCAQKAAQEIPSLASKRVSPHTVRHTTAFFTSAFRGRHQHDPRLARARFAQHHPCLCRVRPGDESQGTGEMRVHRGRVTGNPAVRDRRGAYGNVGNGTS